MLNKIRNRAVWQPIIDHYPGGAKTASESENLVVEVVSGIDAALVSMDHCIRVGLEFGSKKRRKEEGFKEPPIKGLFIFDGHKTKPIKLTVSRSLATIGNCQMFLGHEHAVMRLVHQLTDEMQKVWDDCWA